MMPKRIGAPTLVSIIKAPEGLALQLFLMAAWVSFLAVFPQTYFSKHQIYKIKIQGSLKIRVYNKVNCKFPNTGLY